MSIPKLLYVDDEFINLQLFRYNFEEEFELFLASSGEEALKLIENENIEVIISDLKMPQMNGIELLEIIKEKNPQKICFILSAFDFSEAIGMGLNMSKIDKYIGKPWNRISLLGIINEAFYSIS